MLHADDLQKHYDALVKYASVASARRRRIPFSLPSPTEGDVPQLTSAWSPNSSDASSPASTPPSTPEEFPDHDYVDERYLDKRSDDLVKAFRCMSVSHRSNPSSRPLPAT
ncbi:hypothetical protein HDZ31DRAFT_68924 [Schizophyllum fasciatum]